MKTKLLLLILLGFVISITQANATNQYPDKITIDGIVYSIRNNPMEPYFDKYPEKRPKSGIMSSALHRGYIASFTIIDNMLYLTDIKIKVSRKKSNGNTETVLESVYHKIFPGKSNKIVDLYNGILVVYLKIDKSNKERKYLLMEVANGIKKEERIYKSHKFHEFMDIQFNLYKETSKYKNNFSYLRENNDEEEEVEDEFIESLIRKYTANFTSRFTD